MTALVHALTPGDHYSPRTGSAVPTVVDGLARAARAGIDAGFENLVLLQHDTYRPRYDSAGVLEYAGVAGPTGAQRRIDMLRGALLLPRRHTERYHRPLTERLADEEPAVVLAHNAPVLPRMLAGSGHAAVLYAHNDVLRSYRGPEAARAVSAAAAVIAVSEALADRLRGRLPARLGERVHVVRNGVDTERFAPRDRSLAASEPEVPRILFVGRTNADKGPDVLVRAAGLLRRAREVEVLVIGSDGFDPTAPLTPYEREMREIAERSPARVRFLPFLARPELPDLLRSADVCVVPSVWFEPSTLTVGEAMASGVPVVASRVGGIPEVAGDAALLVEPGDPAALADALDRLLDSPELRAELARRGRERAERHDWAWSWSRLTETLRAAL